MQIETPRLILRSLTPDDAQDIALATEESWDDISRWMRWATDFEERTDLYNCAQYAQHCHDLFQQGKDLTFGGFLKETGEFVLLSRIAPHLEKFDWIEFCGYWCRTNQQNKGLMTEAVQALVDYCFDTLKAKGLTIKHAPGNGATRAVMKKVGFIETDILKNAHQLPDGTMVNEHILELKRK